MIASVSSAGVSFNRLIGALGGAPVSRQSSDLPAQSVDPTRETPPVEAIGKTELTPEEQAEIEKLAQRDAEVHRHEQAHKAAAGQAATSGPTFSYQTGPDGRRYAVGGEVQIDTSSVPNDPQATIRKMQQVQRAANAPAEPSSQDRQVAAQAAAAEQKARAELTQQRSDETGKTDGQVTGKTSVSGKTPAQAGLNTIEETDRLPDESRESKSTESAETETVAYALPQSTKKNSAARPTANDPTDRLLRALRQQDAPAPGRFIDALV